MSETIIDTYERVGLKRPESDRDPYWDVLGDGWNPGHTLTPEEVEYEERTLTCFRSGWYDFQRKIYWKYTAKPEQPTEFNAETRREFSKNLREAHENLKPHAYEVEE